MKRKISHDKYLQIQIDFTVARLREGVQSGQKALAQGAKDSADLFMQVNNLEFYGPEEDKVEGTDNERP